MTRCTDRLAGEATRIAAHVEHDPGRILSLRLVDRGLQLVARTRGELEKRDVGHMRAGDHAKFDRWYVERLADDGDVHGSSGAGMDDGQSHLRARGSADR